MLRLRSILVPYDFSTHADRALDHAHALARLHGARLDVFYAVEVRPVPSFDAAGRLHLYTDDPVEKPAARALAQVVARYEGVPLAAHVERGPAVEEILAFAERHDTDLIVMSSHGYTGLRRVLLGSVARAVLDGAPCPVLLLRAFAKSLLVEEADASAAMRDP